MARENATTTNSSDTHLCSADDGEALVSTYRLKQPRTPALAKDTTATKNLPSRVTKNSGFNKGTQPSTALLDHADGY